MNRGPDVPWIARFLYDPQPLARLELIRIVAPLAILGFMSSRIPYAADWLSIEGFRVPDLGTGPHQPIYLPPLVVPAAWALVVVLVASGLALAAGLFTRISAAVFAACLAYVALADRLAAFTVSKLGTVVAIALLLSPAGARWSIDAWRRRRRAPEPAAAPPTLVSGGSVRFFQLLLIVVYFSSGIAKAKGDWLAHGDVVWSHLHDSYQTWVTYQLALHLPGPVWTFFQGVVLAFEAGAPLWFALPWTRTPALVVGLGMHAFIGLCFGPVVWFALLMATLLVASFAPAAWIERALDRATARSRGGSDPAARSRAAR